MSEENNNIKNNQREIKAETKNLYDTFDGIDKFVIPDYQRPYAWKKEDQVSNLIDDLYNSFENKDNFYFLGTIVLSKREGVVKDKESFDVIDGQQRLTTFLILLKVFCDDKSLEVNSENEIQNIFDDGLRKIVIMSNGYNNKLRDCLYQDNQNKKDNRYIEAKECIQKELEKLKTKEDFDINKFFEFILKKTSLILVKTPDTSTAIDIFTKMHTRGLNLTEGDVIKSLIMKYKTEQEESVQDDWNDIQNVIDPSIKDKTSTLQMFHMYKKHTQLKKSLSYEFEHDVIKTERKKERTMTQLVSEIRNFSEDLPNNQDKLEKYKDDAKKYYHTLFYLDWSQYWRVIIATVKEHNTGNLDINKVIILLTKYYYTNWICGKSLNQVRSTSFEIIKRIKDGGIGNKELEEVIKKSIAEKCLDGNSYNEDSFVSLMVEKLSRQDLYRAMNGRCLRSLFILKEIWRFDATNSINFDDKKNWVEHLIPQKYDQYLEKLSWSKDDWVNFETKYMHSMGNLFLLEGEKNQNASNNSMKTKKEKYLDKNNRTRFEVPMDIVNKVINNNIQWSNLQDIKEALLKDQDQKNSKHYKSVVDKMLYNPQGQGIYEFEQRKAEVISSVVDFLLIE